jgi:transposase
MTERGLSDKADRRRAIIQHAQEVTGNVAETCRHFGISRPTYYRWVDRYEAEGADGLNDRSSRPLTSPMATTADVVAQIGYLRQNYHLSPLKISLRLKRHHDIDISSSGVWLVLKRLGMNRLPSTSPPCDERWNDSCNGPP